MRRIVTISFTPLDAGGGVPKFNRDLHSSFPDRERRHFSWWDFPWCIEMEGLPEWEKARTLNHYLVMTRKVTVDDIIVADGFWADGLQHLPFAISHSHGIWGHVTKDDVERGVTPENPMHHAVQVEFRRRWTEQGKHIAAVSEFIAEQMRLQWGFVVDRVIDNGVDTDIYRPSERDGGLNDPLIIHGVNDVGNVNKGWDHIEYLKRELVGFHVLSLDEALAFMQSRWDSGRCSGPQWTKPEVLALADLVVHPSGFEGNSMFVAETLACGVPIVAYDVGFLWSIRQQIGMEVGFILDRNKRSPALTEVAVQAVIHADLADFHRVRSENARRIALERLSISRFRESWRSYVQEIENAA